MFSVEPFDLLVSLSDPFSSEGSTNSSHPSAKITMRDSSRPSAFSKERNRASSRAVEGCEGIGEVYMKRNDHFEIHSIKFAECATKVS